METKSYLITDHKEVIFDNDKIQEWKKLAEDLGATGQMALVGKEDKSMLPFPIMTEAEKAVYDEIFNRKQGYKDFSAEAIPMEGLSLIALAEKDGYFDKIQIWYSQENPVPIIVGRRYADETDREKEYSWNMLCYMIFQWGPKLKPLKYLIPLYDQTQKEKIKTEYERKVADHEAMIKKFNFQIASFQ